ncbi:MAG: DsbA family protein [Gemmatimonadetes bacterium]|nr:thioredoxin domain-containing protein [Gemmatimonadota bacterium]MXX34110.1 DsbA family protein [Gemmatimonadota bacterium]MYD12562.1 DsbA family protein [Gemmatimonadota bacterium]MYI64799.1 DsbA family protein [Gemmatimonadota bacterium]
MKRFYVVLGIVAVVGAAVVAVALRGGTPVIEPVDLGDITDQELVDLAQGVVYGDPDAPLTIMEFADYQCPSCGYFALSVKPFVDTDYIETGQAKLVFHDFPLDQHPHAFLAARAARCAGDQDRYFEYHDEVFRTQMEWTGLANPAAHFKDLAGDIELDAGAFGRCLDSDMHADVVTANRRLGERLGVGGTPAIFVHDGQALTFVPGFEFAHVQQAMEAAGSGN